jgi:hypothetical protein
LRLLLPAQKRISSDIKQRRHKQCNRFTEDRRNQDTVDLS